MLVALPIGLLVFSLVSDVIFLTGWGLSIWNAVAYYTMMGGVVGGVLAAIPGFIDYLLVRDRRVKKIATTHMILNLAVVALFIFNLGIRYNAANDNDLVGVTLSIVGIGILAVSGWLGGSLVYVHRVAVEPSTEERRAA
jgi:uncharacterized membrane protein